MPNYFSGKVFGFSAPSHLSIAVFDRRVSQPRTLAFDSRRGFGRRMLEGARERSGTGLQDRLFKNVPDIFKNHIQTGNNHQDNGGGENNAEAE